MRRISLLVCIFLLIPFFSLHARDNIIFYQMGDRNPALWSILKTYFTGKGYGVSIYEGADSIEKQIQNANKIGKEKAAIFLAVELVPSEKRASLLPYQRRREERAVFLKSMKYRQPTALIPKNLPCLLRRLLV